MLQRRWVQFMLAVVLPVVWLAIVRWGFTCVMGEPDPDSYFHAQLAELGPRCFTAKTFPYLTQSVWCETFSDKELGYHYILWGLFRLRTWVGLDNLPPFHFHAVFFCSLLILMMVLLLERLKVTPMWVYTLLLVTVYQVFTNRMLFLRAYVLAITLYALSLYLLSSDAVRSRRRLYYGTAFGLGFLFSWCYSNPHIVVLPVGAFALAEFARDRRWRPLFLLPLVALAGVVAGYTLHPQFPNTFIIFKIQCIDVPLRFLGLTRQTPIELGAEFYFSVWGSLKRYPCLLLYPPLIGLLVWRNPRAFWHAGWRNDVVFNAVGLLALSTGCGFLLVFRLAEYGIFSLVVFLALVAEKSCRNRPVARGRMAPSCRLVPTFYAVFCFISACIYYINFKPSGVMPFYGVAKWAESIDLPAGSIIGNLVWSDFPHLFYAMPAEKGYRYLNGLDPMFGYAYAPQLTETVYEHLRYRQILPPAAMRELLGTEYVFVSQVHPVLIDLLPRYGYERVYHGWDGAVFHLTDRAMSPAPSVLRPLPAGGKP